MGMTPLKIELGVQYKEALLEEATQQAAID